MVFQIPQVASYVDFISIGSNDLIQYLLAVDRNNSQVSELYQSLHPAVLKAIHQIIQAGENENTPISVCGEMASDPFACILLLGMGVSSLSTNIAALPTGDLTTFLIVLPIDLTKLPSPYNCLGCCILDIAII